MNELEQIIAGLTTIAFLILSLCFIVGGPKLARIYCKWIAKIMIRVVFWIITLPIKIIFEIAKLVFQKMWARPKKKKKKKQKA